MLRFLSLFCDSFDGAAAKLMKYLSMFLLCIACSEAINFSNRACL